MTLNYAADLGEAFFGPPEMDGDQSWILVTAAFGRIIRPKRLNRLFKAAQSCHRTSCLLLIVSLLLLYLLLLK